VVLTPIFIKRIELLAKVDSGSVLTLMSTQCFYKKLKYKTFPSSYNFVFVGNNNNASCPQLIYPPILVIRTVLFYYYLY
jgi:hypothetical protein